MPLEEVDYYYRNMTIEEGQREKPNRNRSKLQKVRLVKNSMKLIWKKMRKSGMTISIILETGPGLSRSGGSPQRWLKSRDLIRFW